MCGISNWPNELTAAKLTKESVHCYRYVSTVSYYVLTGILNVCPDFVTCKENKILSLTTHTFSRSIRHTRSQSESSISEKY